MAIREVTSDEAVPSLTRSARMVRVLITEDQNIYAVWQVEKGKKHREWTIEVSGALKDLIIARATFQNALTQIADDTHPRTGT